MSQASSPLMLRLVAPQVPSLQAPGPGGPLLASRLPRSRQQVAPGLHRPPPKAVPLRCEKSPPKGAAFPRRCCYSGPSSKCCKRSGSQRPCRCSRGPGPARTASREKPRGPPSGSGPSPLRADHARVTEAGGDRGPVSVAPPVVLGRKDRRGWGQRQVLAFSRPPSPLGPSPVQGAGWADDRRLGAR